tara:strand:- start:2832 stop:3089 length:258 start_codon:yes stop_codon:yes gene_type:complete
MPGQYTKSLKKKLLKKPDSIKPKLIKVIKHIEIEPDTNRFKIDIPKKREPIEYIKLKKKKKKKGKEAAVISNRLKRMKEGSLYTK